MQRGAFHRPGLGLIVQVMGLFMLPSLVGSTIQMIAMRSTIASTGLVAASVLLVVAALTRVALGVAFEHRAGLVIPALALHVAAVITSIIAASVATDASLSPAMVVELVLDVVIAPGVMIVACIVTPRSDASERRSAGDVGVGLLALSIGAVISAPIQAVLVVRDLGRGHPSALDWLGAMTWPMLHIIIAMLQMIAGILTWRWGWPRARRGVLAWLILTIGGSLVLEVIALVVIAFERDAPGVIGTSIAAIVLQPIAPVLIWRYASKIGEADDRRSGATTMAGWLAITMAPMVAGGGLALMHRGNDQMETGLAVLALFTGLLAATAGFAAIRHHRATVVFAAAASLVAVTLASIAGVYYLEHPEGTPNQTLWLLGFVAGIPVVLTLASLHLGRDPDAAGNDAAAQGV